MLFICFSQGEFVPDRLKKKTASLDLINILK
jgi:hypothetical protein